MLQHFLYDAFTGPRPKGTFERAAPAIQKVSKTMMEGNGDVFHQLKGRRGKESTDVCGNLEDFNNGNIEEDIVDGFLFQSYSKASDLPPMQPMCNFEVLSLYLQCIYSIVRQHFSSRKTTSLKESCLL